MDTQSAYCTFSVDALHFGVEVLRVQEVLREQPMTRIPRSSPIVRGLMNLRGQIVTALDLRRRIGLPERPAGRPAMNVVIRTSEGPVSLLVDEIGDVLQLDSERFELPPDTLQGLPRELIRGVYKLDDRLLMVLNLEPTLRLSA
jgi:purine-binding chemotaxis protein CheW